MSSSLLKVALDALTMHTHSDFPISYNVPTCMHFPVPQAATRGETRRQPYSYLLRSSGRLILPPTILPTLAQPGFPQHPRPVLRLSTVPRTRLNTFQYSCQTWSSSIRTCM